MFFKNLKIYQITQSIAVDNLGEQLAEQVFKPCGSQEPSRIGWVSPLGKGGEMLTHTVGDCIMLCARKQERVLPPAVVNEILEEKILEIEAAGSRRVYRKERASLKDELIFEMLPKTFTKSSNLFGYIDTKRQLIFINTASASKAEELLSLLRESIGTLPVVPLSVESDISFGLTEWLNSPSDAPKAFTIGADCVLQDQADEKNIVRCKHQEMEAAEVSSLLSSGKQVTELALTCRERISFKLDERLSIKSIKFEDILQDRLDNMESEDAATLFDNNFSIMSLELGVFIDDLLWCFGGAQASASPATTTQAPAAAETEDEPLYNEAVKFVVEKQRGSVSALQRKLRIGYNRSFRMLERMEREGIVSEIRSDGGRTVLKAAA